MKSTPDVSSQTQSPMNIASKTGTSKIKLQSSTLAFPLSPLQEGMLFHSLSGHSGVDITQITCDWHEEIEAVDFARSWQKLVERHSILRTSFSWEDLKSPHQQIHEQVHLPIRQEDWRGLSPEEQEQRLNGLLQADRQMNFEVNVPPLLRVTLICLGQGEYQFVWTVHHLLADARTFAILLNDLFVIYQSLRSGQEPSLQSVPDYRAYIEWFQQQDWSEAENFWRKRLEGFSTPTPLSIRECGSNGSPAEASWAEEEAILTDDLVKTLREAGKAHGLTLNTFLQGAWSVVLSRYSGEEDVVFGAVKACHHLPIPGAEHIAGPLINTLPIRVRCTADQDVVAWLKALREQWLELRRFEHSPLVKVQSWSQVPAGSSLFQTIVSLLDPPWDAGLRAGGKRSFRIRNQPNYPLALDAYVTGAARLKLVYDAALFRRAAMRRMLGHLQTVLEAMASNPKQRLGDLPLLTEPERWELLEKWNDTAKSYPAADCVHRLFEARVKETPEAPAISCGSIEISYQQLNARANQVAHRLRNLGVGAEARVGICMERSAENISGLLGILKAGAAYVPLDPEHPTERLEFMISDAGIQILVTQRKWVPKLPETATQVLCLDEIETSKDTSDLPIELTPENLAYVIYTSGSTGTPKGVEIEHRGLLNLIRWHQEQYQLRREDRATQLANLCFDASVWELWPYLTAGASVHIPDEQTRLNPDTLVKWLAAEKITMTFLPTPLAEAIMDGPWPKETALRVLLTGGDRLRRAPRGELPFRFVNHYGPTENSVVTTAASVQPQGDVGEAPPIGRPIANTQLYVLDTDMRPVPVGVPGELYIAGAGLARGYLNRPKLTTEKFVANPFGTGPFSRLYRTGDLVRYRDDGNLEFLGRIDQQVKLRGYRIELGEIETVLASRSDVREAVVLARDEGETYLAAYVVVEKGSTLTAQELRNYLKGKLPEHMVPAAFVFLDTLPLTPNGKVDRKALPAPELQSAGKIFVAPRNDVEELLAAIWCELLHLKKVGIHDNFFQLGGHSLLATQLISRVRNAFGAELPLQSVFEAPTVGEFAARLAEAGKDQSWSRPVSRKPDENGDSQVKLSFAQERLWFLEHLEPGLPVYNVPVGITLVGDLNITALEQSLSALLARHGVLRTSFESAQGLPKARRATAAGVELQIIPLDGLPEEEQRAEMERIMASEAALPFDLGQAPLLRTKILRLSAGKHLLLLTTHHIISDGWSMAILYKELRDLYETSAHGESISLPPLPVQFDDYARWQRKWLQGAVLEKELAFWKQQLRGPLPALDLPVDHPRSARQSHRGGVKHFALPNNLYNDLQSLCRQEGVTLFMLLVAAFQTLLHRYSGQDDIVTGTTVAGRTRSEIEGLVGLFVNTLALRTDLSGDVTFRELLQRVRKVALEAYAHQDVPFEKVVDALGVERDLSLSPVFQAMFVLQKAPLPSSRAGDLEWTATPLHSGTSKFDLTLSLEEHAQGLAGYLEYDSDLFEPDTALRMLGHFQTLLQAAVENPNQKLWELPLLTAAERDQVLVEWNATRTEFSSALRIHDLFEAQVARTPDTVAVVFEEESLTYQELNSQANRLAHHLQDLGVGPDVIVGIYVERSLEMLLGIVAILKAGGAYVPIDPDYPKKRIEYILEDSRASIVLTQKSLIDELPSFAGQSICLDADWAEIATESAENPVTQVKPENLAYVLFTSGSTGRPKGVALEHRTAATFVQWAKEVFTPEELAGVLFSTSLCFDLSVFELFVTLSAGGKVILARNALHLPSLPQKDEVTLINTVPSAIAELLHMGGVPASVKTVNLAGEPLSDTLVEQIHAKTNVDKVYNLYGPTETTTYSTYTLVQRGSPVTIGKPIAGTQCYILDAHRNPVPIGVMGELYIAGGGLARGYYGRPELTNERFVPIPFSEERGARMYRTGDLCRWLPDGHIQYLGRIDHQVKLRGFRIELGEIEAGLAQYPALREVAVIPREDSPGDKRLVAYVVADNPPTDLVEQLRALVRAAMPEYMVPAHFVMMQALPRTPNGKLDRKALPAPEGTAYTTRDHEDPLGEIEATLAQIWSDVLKIERVGRHDRFFDLGGHSLLAVRTVSRIRDVFGVDLPTRTLFEKPALSELAKVLTGAKGSGGNVQRIEPRTHSGPCALSFAQERFWLLHQLAPTSPVYNILDVIPFEGTCDAEVMRRALNETVRRHEILRTVFAESHEEATQIVLPKVDLMLSELDLSALPKQEGECEWICVVRDEGRKSFDLSQAPLLRATLVHLTPQQHRLLLTLHHVIADERSMEVLHQEVKQLYTEFSQGQPSPLPELPIQYADFACWQRSWLQGEVRQKQITYWKNTLAGAPTLLELPTDKPRPAVQSLRGATETFALPSDLVEQLKALGRPQQATLFMTLEAGFAALLHRYTGQEDILVGTPMSGRPHSETERLIGCFINTIVLRAQFTNDLTFRSLLHQVRERTLGAFAHPDLPFDHLVAELAPERDPSRTPLFQVMFTLFNSGGVSQASQASGLRELETGTSKFDLTLSISETEDGLQGIIEYSTDLFEAQTIRRLYGHYGTLLKEIARDPDQKISRIPILPASERHQLLNEWNNTARNYPKDQCVHQLFEQVAEQAASRTAVEFGGQSLTYGQLNAKANRLANCLRESGVTPDSFVGIYLERSLDLVVGLLAILKAGAAYVPMDPSFPPDRLAYMMNDADISVLVTQSSLLGGLAPSERKVICLDTEWKTIERKDSADPNVALRPSNLAYTLYTSGSTGQPKGVMIEHGSVVNFLVSMQREPGFDDTDVLVAVTTISFDIAALEIFLPLISGGKLVLASRDEVIDGSLLLRRIRSSGATMLQATPATWKLMLEAGWEKTRGLKMLCGGEAFSKELANRMLERGAELWNMYGPTETTIWSAVGKIEPGPDPVLIGPPIANTQLYIVDKELEPVPIGVAGELLIGGHGLSRGYLNRPELIAERFIENPFSGSGRVYRTGDLARFRSDGGIEFLGRLDFQVKVRGFRIELGEIEQVLTQHAGAKDAVAITWKDRDGETQLVAYYIPAVDRPLKARDLGRILREKLPDYMIPSCFVEMEAFPLTPNGKIDRKALPAPSMEDGAPDEVAAPPQTPTEEMVLDVFRAALGRTDFGVSDNFFDLGGHSLLAARLMARLRSVSGVDIPLRDLFARPTVAGLAEAVDAFRWVQNSSMPSDVTGVREEIVL